MSDKPSIFNDGAGYERMMGMWSALAGDVFLRWLAPPKNLRWIDVGCGNGAFTELLVNACAPVEVQGIDPSAGQIAYAKARPAGRVAQFQQGDAMALPFEAARFDAAAMALVIFFVPDPPKAVAEMARVVRPGGIVAAYAWDLPGGGFPLEPLWAELRAMGIGNFGPPNPDASRLDALERMWRDAGLVDIETTEISVTRAFASFDEYWEIAQLSASLKSTLQAMPREQLDRARELVRAKLPAGPDGRVHHTARANAVKGRKPA